MRHNVIRTYVDRTRTRGWKSQVASSLPLDREADQADGLVLFVPVRPATAEPIHPREAPSGERRAVKRSPIHSVDLLTLVRQVWISNKQTNEGSFRFDSIHSHSSLPNSSFVPIGDREEQAQAHRLCLLIGVKTPTKNLRALQILVPLNSKHEVPTRRDRWYPREGRRFAAGGCPCRCWWSREHRPGHASRRTEADAPPSQDDQEEEKEEDYYNNQGR